MANEIGADNRPPRLQFRGLFFPFTSSQAARRSRALCLTRRYAQ